MKSPKSTTLSPDGARAATVVLTALSALSVVTCAAATRTPIVGSASTPPPIREPSPPPPRPAPTPAQPAPAGTEPPATTAPVAPQGSTLARFQAALRDAPQRSEPVRVLWLGDSHTAADFWPDAVRKPLQAAFGSGGPGFVYL